MKTFTLAAAVAFAPVSAIAETLLTVDLSVANQITIAATSGAASADSSGTDFLGFYLAEFFTGAAFEEEDVLVSGDLTTANETSSLSPNLFNAFGNRGLNVFITALETFVSTTAGQTAFTGSATWTISAAAYADALVGPASGSIFLPADTDDDIPNATLIGEWIKGDIAAVPLPAGAWLLGTVMLGLGAAGRRRRG